MKSKFLLTSLLTFSAIFANEFSSKAKADVSAKLQQSFEAASSDAAKAINAAPSDVRVVLYGSDGKVADSNDKSLKGKSSKDLINANGTPVLTIAELVLAKGKNVFWYLKAAGNKLELREVHVQKNATGVVTVAASLGSVDKKDGKSLEAVSKSLKSTKDLSALPAGVRVVWYRYGQIVNSNDESLKGKPASEFTNINGTPVESLANHVLLSKGHEMWYVNDKGECRHVLVSFDKDTGLRTVGESLGSFPVEAQ